MDNFSSIRALPEEAGLRLDLLLAKRLNTLGSRSYFQMLIESQKVTVNGSSAKKCLKPEAGDLIEVHLTAPPQENLLPEEIPLEILYEDEVLIAINKPAGMVVHPACGNWSGTFANALMHHCGEELSNDLLTDGTLRPGIVHRLDKETSGVLIAAKNRTVLRLLLAQFAAREIDKEYLAICIGSPPNGIIDLPIGRHPHKRKMMAITSTGRPAITISEKLAFNAELALLKLKIITGRTHQIRVHLQHLGSPVLGDPLYGCERVNRKYGATRQMLHAKCLQLKHPLTQEMLKLEAPIPSDMQEIIRKEKLCAS